MLRLHRRTYHHIMDSFRDKYNEHAPVVYKARMYIYDAVMMQHGDDILGVNMDYVLSSRLTQFLDIHVQICSFRNKRRQFYRRRR